MNYSDNVIVIDERRLHLPYKIKEAHEISNNILILFAPGEFKSEEKAFNNLHYYDRQGRMLWVAELPTDEPMDRYYKIKSIDPIIAYSVCSYSCNIDPSTGKIIESKFYK